MSYKKMLEDVNKREKIQAITSGNKRNHGVGRKFADIFFAEDVGDVGSYIFSNVIIPSIKRVLSQSFNALLYGKTSAPRDNYGGGAYRDYTSYRTYFDDDRPSRRAQLPRSSRIYHWDDISYQDDPIDVPGGKTGEEKAQLVLDKLFDDAHEYKTVSLQWLYEYSGLEAPWTSNNYGWTANMLRSADIVNLGGGEWAIKMPKPMPIEQ